MTEFVKGTKISSRMDIGQDHRKSLAAAGLQSAIVQILEHGFYHADPHPGNMVITRDNRLCLMDWGMVGRLTPEERNDLLFLIRAAVDRDSRKLARTVLSLATPGKEVQIRHLEKDLMEIMDIYMSLPLKEIRVGTLLEDLVEVLKSHTLRLPPDLSIVIKALITVEGTARMLYPELDVISEATPMCDGWCPGSTPKAISGSGCAATCPPCGDCSSTCPTPFPPFSEKLKPMISPSDLTTKT